MAPTPPAPPWEEIDPYIEAYERSQAGGGWADLADFLPEPGHPHYLAVLRELVRADIEYGWGRGAPRRAEDYLAAYPALRADPEGLVAVAFEEYRQRWLAGDAPSPAEYRRRLGVETAHWPSSFRGPGLLESPADTPDTARPAGAGEPGAASEADFSLDELRRSDPDTADRLERAFESLPAPGGQFLGFRLVRQLGRGAFGRVYLATQGDLAGRPVALKVSADLRGESQSLARLQHSNIVPVYSVHRAGSLQALCMPYFGSLTLADVLRQPQATGVCPLVSLSGAARVREVLRVVARLADGLAYAHARGIVHQDLKPANVLLADDGTPMLLDFNLAQDLQRPGGPAAYAGGTLPYMAPEQLEAFRDNRLCADPRSDLYSLGLILYELLALRLPFAVPPGSLPERVARLLADRAAGAPDVRRDNPAVTPAVASVVRRCLEPDPAHRYQSAAELRDDLERHLADRPLLHAPEPSWRERAAKWARRHPRLTSGYAVAAVAAVLFAALGGLYAVNARRLTRAEAADTRRLFADDLRHARFLLGGPAPGAGEVAEGTEAARRAIGRYGVLDGPGWDAAPAVAALPAEQRERLRADLRELFLLMARGTRLRATTTDRDARLAEALRLNELAEACDPGEEALYPVLLQRAALLALAGRDGEARGLMRRAEAMQPRTARDLYLAAVERMAHGDYGAARDLLRLARRLDAQDPFIHYALGLCHAEMKEHHAAAEALRAAVALWPEFFGSHYQLARAHNELKEYEEAAAELDEAIRLRPDFLDAYIDRGLVRLSQQHYNAAEADLTHALEAGTPATRVYFIRAHVRGLAGNAAGAAADRAEGLRREPTDEVSWVARGVARLDDDPKGALADFDAALAANPHYLPALEDRAAVLSERLGRTEDAVKALADALDVAPEAGQNRAARAVLLARLGRRDGALREAKEAERRDPRPEVLYQAAGAYALSARANADDRREALRLLGAALHAGYGFDLIEGDPDLRPLQGQADFRRLVEAARALRPAAEKNSRPGGG